MTIEQRLSAIRGRAKRVEDNHVGWSEPEDVRASLDDVAPLLEAVEAVMQESSEGRNHVAAWLSDWELGHADAMSEIYATLTEHLGGGDDER